MKIGTKRRSAGDKDYINNKEFTALIVQEQRKGPEHDISRTRLFELIQILVERAAGQFNFRNYPYLDDMKQEALMACIKAVKNAVFDETKENGFAYYKSIVNNAFIAIIKKENRQLSIKWKNAMDMALGNDEMMMELEDVIQQRDRLTSDYQAGKLESPIGKP